MPNTHRNAVRVRMMQPLCERDESGIATVIIIIVQLVLE